MESAWSDIGIKISPSGGGRLRIEHLMPRAIASDVMRPIVDTIAQLMCIVPIEDATHEEIGIKFHMLGYIMSV